MKRKALKTYEEKKKSNPTPILRRAIEKLLGSGSDCSLACKKSVFTIGEKKKEKKELQKK